MKKTSTKNLFLKFLIALILPVTQLSAQNTAADSLAAPGKNLLKMNLAALVLNTYSFQYERALNPRMSLAMGYRFMPSSHLPFNAELKNIADGDDARRTIREFVTSNYALTPEFRYYLTKGLFRGFYLGPFVRFSKYQLSAPFHLDEATAGSPSSILLKGDMNTITGGVLVGAQWKLTKQLYLDWWILGPNYGWARGNLSGRRSLNEAEQQELIQQIVSLANDIKQIKASFNVDGNGADIRVKSPWGGARAGLALGYCF